MDDQLAKWRGLLAELCTAVEDGCGLEDLLIFIGEHIEDEDVRPMLALSVIAYVERVNGETD
jgi:hypothetical protein